MKYSKKELLNNDIIERLNDDNILAMVQELPDPDELLRKAGVDDEVYREILSDAHVMGDVRQLYSSLLGFKYEVQAGGDSNRAKQALELCQLIFKKRPHRTMRWNDFFWSIGKSPLTGRRVHALKWVEKKGKLIPEQIMDIPARKFAFNHDGELLIKSMENPQGEVAPEERFLVTRHMADATNPYGLAILSCCFWPWMFKNGGLKFFVRFCERFGQPFPVGKYPEGTDDDKIDKLVDALKQLVEDAVAAIPDDESITLLESKSSGQLPQERLALLMNREISKALTSQTAASELTGEGGSRAASETHKGRSDQNAKADRALVEDTMNQLFEFITIVNFGEDVPAPKFTYVDEKQITLENINIVNAVASKAPILKQEYYDRTGFSIPTDKDDVVFFGANQQQEVNQEKDRAEFAKSKPSEWTDLDTIISDIVGEVKEAVSKGNTLEEALSAIENLATDFDQEVLHSLVKNELELDFGQGMLEAEDE